MIDFATLANVTVVLAQGMGVAIEIFLLTLLFSLPLGLLVAFGTMSKCAPVRCCSTQRSGSCAARR